jgi:hypothetical protein
MTGLYSAYVRHTDDAVTGAVKADWPAMIGEIVSQGCSIDRLADALGLADAAVIAWREGAIPNYEYGRRLIVAHRLLVGVDD